MVMTKTASRGGTAAEDLAARLAEAERAEEEPRRKANKLEAELAAAVTAERFGDAERLKGELHEARSELALAVAATAALRDGQAVVERERQAAERTVQEARRRSEAHRVIEAALVAERQVEETVDVALNEMREHISAARTAYQKAVSLERGVREARSRAVQARADLGEFPPGSPGPVVVGSNRARVLADNDPVVKALVRGRP